MANKNWIGYGSKDANETFSEIFVYNYTGLREQSNQAKFEDMFLENIGHCKIMTNYPNPIKVGISILILKFVTFFFTSHTFNAIFHSFFPFSYDCRNCYQF